MVIRHSIRIWDGILGYRFGDVGVKRLFTAAAFELVSRTIYLVTEPTKDIQPPFHKGGASLQSRIRRLPVALVTKALHRIQYP